MPQITNTDGEYGSFIEETPGELTGKEDYLVEFGAADGTVKLLATVGQEIGTVALIDPATRAISVRFLNAGGLIKCVQSAAIAHKAQVMGVVGGKVATATATNRVIGRKYAPAAGGGANNDRIGVLPDRDRLP